MKRLCILVALGTGLVTSVIADLAVSISGEVKALNLSTTDLHKLHMCLCNDAHNGCQFHEFGQSVTGRRPEPSQYNKTTEYSNVYKCSLVGTDIECTRNPVPFEGKQFSLYNETCDLKCVGFIWDTAVSNIIIYTDKISAERCPATSISGSQKQISKTTIIVIVVVSIIVVIIISAIIVICLCVKRKKKLNTKVMYTPNTGDNNYTDKDNTNGLYAVSFDTSWHSGADKAQEPLYFEVEKDKDPREIREAIELQSNNVYTKLHEKAEHVANTYDVLPRNSSQN